MNSTVRLAHKKPPLQHTSGGMQEDYRHLLAHLRNDIEASAQTAAKMVQAIDEAMEVGSTVSLQPQVNFLTGALFRMAKDWGVIEHMQSRGAKSRRRV